MTTKRRAKRTAKQAAELKARLAAKPAAYRAGESALMAGAVSLDAHTEIERRAAGHCYAAFIAPGATPVERYASWEAYQILRDRSRRTAFMPVSNSASDLDLHLRSRHCGRYTMEGTAHDGRGLRFMRLSCKCWNCAYCGRRKAKRYKVVIGREAERLKLSRLLTLTLDPKKTPVKGAVTEIKKVWARFRAQLRKRYGTAPNYICVMEFQHKTKMPHLHVLIDRYIEWEWCRKIWEQAGGGAHVDIRAGKKNSKGFVDLHRVAHYLSKYLTTELLCSAPKRSRRVTTSKAVTLNAKMIGATLYQWEMRHETVFSAYFRFRESAEGAEWGPDLVLQGFTVPKPATQ